MTTKKEILKEIKLESKYFCDKFFSDDYYKVVNKLIKSLNENKNFSMDKGKILGWVAGLIYVVGEDSKLFDQKNFYKGKIYMSKAELSRCINISITTMKSRERVIREHLLSNGKFIANIKDEFSYFNKDGSFNHVAMDKNLENIISLLTESKKEEYEIYMDKAINAEFYDEAIDYAKLALNSSKKYIKDDFNSLIGFFWMVKETRPYMMVKESLAQLYVKGEEYDKAVVEYEDMLRLNPNDNQGIRYKLINLFIILDENEKFESLVSNYEEECAFMLYTKALYYFKENQIFNAKLNLKKAFKENDYIPKYLIGLEIVSNIPDVYSYGSKEEGMIYFDEAIDTWLSVDKSLFWITDNYFDYAKKNNISIICTKDEAIEILKEAIGALRKMNLLKI